jgi:pantoate--beta-alanine ligase
MEQILTASSLRQTAAHWHTAGKRVAVVPTSGSIHEGHLLMIREARSQADIVVVSLFCNPLQFGASENFAGYPRTTPEDIAACEQAGADAVFTPATEEIYPKGYSSVVMEEQVAKPLCGVSRPAHFKGVTTYTTILINLVRPELLVLGQKDAQTAAVVRKMIADLHFDTQLLVTPIVREADGLACSTRNRHLSPTQRQEATALNRALLKAREMAEAGVRSVDRIVAEVTHILRQQRRVRVIYISIVDPVTMEPVREILPGRCLLTLAAWVEEVRLTDNILL